MPGSAFGTVIESLGPILSGDAIARSCDAWFAYVASEASDFTSGAKQFKVHPDCTEYLNPFDPSEIRADTTVFCKTDYVYRLVAYCRQMGISTPFVLVTGQSDYPITDELVQSVARYLPTRWHGVNACTRRVEPIPLGIGPSLYRECVRDGFRLTSARRLLYVNHRTETFPSVRGPLYHMFEQAGWATVQRPFPIAERHRFLDELCEHKFMLCPRGNGIDTHRMWEALCCGVIPVVERHFTHTPLEGLLPVLAVDSFSEVTEALLEDTWGALQQRTWQWEALGAEWWMRRIRDRTRPSA
ncbi:MAG: hypothetical protein FGM37_07865 [Phycisphaerales bacterium]|nr:hypothetical protein [Phycisphaerales bacterium]